MIIGITGSSGSGKSTVCEIMQNKYVVHVLNADKIARSLSKKGNEYLNEIVKIFGEKVLQEDGELDRYELSEIIYNNEEEREKLNNCTFKYITKEILNRIDKINEEYIKANETVQNEKNAVQESLKNVNEPIIVIDAPLLFEAEIERYCNFVIAVISENIDIQVERIEARDLLTKKQAMARLKAQKPNEYYISKSKYVITNNDEIGKLEEQINSIFEKELSF